MLLDSVPTIIVCATRSGMGLSRSRATSRIAIIAKYTMCLEVGVGKKNAAVMETEVDNCQDISPSLTASKAESLKA
jgi:hypothetical protein